MPPRVLQWYFAAANGKNDPCLCSSKPQFAAAHTTPIHRALPEIFLDMHMEASHSVCTPHPHPLSAIVFENAADPLVVCKPLCRGIALGLEGKLLLCNGVLQR